MIRRPSNPIPLRASLVPALLLLALLGLHREAPGFDGESIEELQASYIENRDTKADRAYHFGTQGAGDVFSNHTSHTNRLIPVYTFGRAANLSAFTGEHSAYRDEQRVEALYGGTVPENTVNPEADYADQSDLYHLQKQAVEHGARHLFVVLFDGMDWPTIRAAALARTGVDSPEGPGSGLVFQNATADGTAQTGFVVTSPTHASADLDLNAQAVQFPDDVLRGGYDARFGGATPWSKPERVAPGYIRGQSATPEELQTLRSLGGVPHAYTDSAASAAEIASGVKSYNDSINVGPDGRFLPTVFHDLQADGWKVGTVSSVPFNHASPAAMYARNVSRDDYQDLARDMLGLRSIAVERGAPRLPGLDVVLGTGFGQSASLDRLRRSQGDNAEAGNTYITADDLAAIDQANGGPYVVSQRAEGTDGAEALQSAAERAATDNKRLFGFYGTKYGHLPFQTADGQFDPVPGIRGQAESYSPADLSENPTLADMTRAALTVLAADPDQPFALFVEPGDVDWALHDNNLDNAIGAVYSGEEAIRVIFDWIASHSSWDESVVIVTADHGHYLVIDRPAALAGSASR